MSTTRSWPSTARPKPSPCGDLATGGTFNESYDKLILSPGATPIVPDLPGIHARGVFTRRNIEDMDRIAAALPQARRAVVIGAGYVGLEVAEQFRHRDLEVTVVELQPQILPFLDREMAEPVQREIERNGVRLALGQGFASIEERDGAARGVILADGTALPTDIVLLGIGVRSNVGLAEATGIEVGPGGGIGADAFSRTSDPDIYAVGDAADYRFGPTGARMRVPLAGIANRTGRLAGEHAATGASRPAPAAWGTSIVRVFGRAVGATGLSLRAAAAVGIAARAAHVVGYHHASYYPGAETMALKLVDEPGTGRVLGAQAVGGAGIDKRLDVIATRLHFRGTVHDLAALDLAYAPPFGSAKDPVRMAAFAAENDLDGLAPLMQPADDLSGLQVVDVREPGEAEAAPLTQAPHARRIPLGELRHRMAELDRERPTVLSCRTGLRSYVGARILKQHGFAAVFNLPGAAAMRDYALNRGAPGVAVLPTPENLGDLSDDA